MQDLDKYGRPTNICNLDLIANIEIRKGNISGNYYLNWIAWVDGLPEGIWREKKISEAEAKKLISKLKPKRKCIGSIVIDDDRGVTYYGEPVTYGNIDRFIKHVQAMLSTIAPESRLARGYKAELQYLLKYKEEMEHARGDSH